ncbi:hypothetical protein NGA_0187600 [Nannochloropsis gaditana CCMP526]|uniref:uncharacterized protein n=1 Tax=Nannochloropsis gaditana (strain CCMP526) TaxID=1093141 RepID=UPI00029F6933|nr:hypothetical protein NGA_0187600 [Nannochloropsis gaditana CCMP526]EKU21862.1 hypothetical protein NGA_0187600 [Nannochloropsis gaditana CCMP526]|eukprot:XP_005854501.1 hypothetical protein NGA_0187600 [Nannochloropsis gaditana CCMP526]
MVRLDMDTSSASLKFRWATPYGRGGLPWYTSRLGPGSGSTPSLTSCQGRDMVVITDGELRMNLIYLDAETARTPVDFGAKVDASRLTSEQSVAVRGCKAFVVNNYVGTDGLDADTQCTDAPRRQGKEELAAFCNKALKQLWARDDVSCGTSIPLISGPSDGR